MEIDTKEALLDAGEKLFAQGGFTALSVRAVTKAAGANLGAVTYHFGTKGQFVEEIFLASSPYVPRLHRATRCIRNSLDRSPANAGRSNRDFCSIDRGIAQYRR
ncbi:MAG: helix-turn-helix domain-containing protein [Caldilineaceae bacterium]